MAVEQLEFAFVNNLPKATSQTATFWGKCKTFGNFLIGDWAKATGIEYHALKKSDKAISIFDAYHRFVNNQLTVDKAIKVSGQAEKIAKATAKAAGTAVPKEATKGFFGSIGKMFGKFGMPILLWLEPITNAISEIKNGGNIVSVAKEFAKGMCGMAGYSAGTLFATAVLGLSTGFWAGAGILALGAIGGMAFNFVAKAILGESTGEKLARHKAEQEQLKQSNPLFQQGSQNYYQQHQQQLASTGFGGYNRYYPPINIQESMQKAEASFRSAQQIFLNRNGQDFVA